MKYYSCFPYDVELLLYIFETYYHYTTIILSDSLIKIIYGNQSTQENNLTYLHIKCTERCE